MLLDLLVFGPLLILAVVALWSLDSETRKVKEMEYRKRYSHQPWMLESRMAMEKDLADLQEEAKKKRHP